MNREKPTGGEGEEFKAGENEYAQLSSPEQVPGKSEVIPPQNEEAPQINLDVPLTRTALAEKLGHAPKTVARALENLRPQYPDLVGPGTNSKGAAVELIQPELQRYIAEQLSEYEKAPSGWMTNKHLARELKVAEETVKAFADSIRGRVSDLPENHVFLDRARRPKEQYPPQLVHLIRTDLETSRAGSGYMTRSALSREIGVSDTTAKKIINRLKSERPELFEVRRHPTKGGSYEMLSPEAVAIVKSSFSEIETLPQDWVAISKMVKKTGVNANSIQKLLEPLRREHPDWIKTGRTVGGSGQITERFSPEAVAHIENAIVNRESVPGDWLTRRSAARAVGISDPTMKIEMDSLKAESPELIKLGYSPKGVIREYVSPEGVEIIRAKRESTAERLANSERLNNNLKSFLEEVAQNESPSAQEFRQLTSLFGSERTLDILYLHHPEYKKIPVPYLRSILPEYLGDYFVIHGEIEIGGLEKGAGYLVDSDLRESLTEVMKGSALRFYNETKRQDPGRDDREILRAYTIQLREQSAGFTNEQLEGVINTVEKYYDALFEQINKPDNLVDELKPDRAFPDINQRINIREVADKYKILIADEMGVGKSASAILAKESLGVKQALIVVPSNVVGVWQNYLSDKRSETGEPIGYFKAGQAPRVLTIEDPKDLEKTDLAGYNYVLLSQERLSDQYVEALGKLKYDMLIVDEVHKLKNISSGTRAENLTKLAEKINGGEEQQYLALLSGTPAPNKVGDIAMVLKLLYPEKFADIRDSELTSQILQGDMLDLRSLLVPRMEMKSLGESIPMPRLEEKLHSIKLSNREREVYNVLLDEDELTASQKLQTLRQYSLNPELLDPTPGIESTKVMTVNSALRDSFVTKDKVVMFVNGYIEGVIRGESNILERLNVPPGVEIRTIEGNVNKEERTAIQQELQDPQKRILLVVSGQTADVGVDFSGAQELFFYNEPWTEYDKRQQMGRVYRPGLKEDLTVTTFYTEGTIEEGIHYYIEDKYHAVEKLLRGIPLSIIERDLLRHNEPNGPNLEIHPEFAKYWQSARGNLLKIFGSVKGPAFGETEFKQFLKRYGQLYADSYIEVGSRSYQANASRLAATLIGNFAQAKKLQPADIHILDVASGPEMLKRHIAEPYAERVFSLDINAEHFKPAGDKRTVGSFLHLPVKNSSIDYANLSLAFHYTSFLPSKHQYERVEVIKELNRVLKPGGRVVMSLIYNEDLKDTEAFYQAMAKCGFAVVEPDAGEVESGKSFRARLITLEKTADCPQDIKELVKVLGPEGLKSFKTARQKGSLRNSYKIATSFVVDDQRHIETQFNQDDQKVLEEEQQTIATLEGLKARWGSIEGIPKEEIYKLAHVARIRAGKKYLLFKTLQSGSGAVVVR